METCKLGAKLTETPIEFNHNLEDNVEDSTMDKSSC